MTDAQKAAAALRAVAVNFADEIRRPVADAKDSRFRLADKALQGAACKLARMKKRGYSKDFTPHGDTGKRYLLDQIPAGLWADVKAKAKREGISLRALILSLLKEWVSK